MALVAAQARAQNSATPIPPTAPDPSKDQWSDVTQVVVRAKAPGPAMWKLTRGTSTVWVLGTLHVAPQDLTWDTTRFRRVLKGATSLILPRVVDDSAPSEDDIELPGTSQLKDVVSAPVYQRFSDDVDRENIQTPTGVTYKPAWAGSWLVVSMFHSHHLTSRIVPDGVYAADHDAGVPINYVERRTPQLQDRQYDHLSPAGNEACLVAYLDSIDRDLPMIDTLGKAWAEGDLTTVLATHHEPPWVACFLADPKYAEAYETYAVDNMVKAMDKALNKPGKTVVVVPLSDLLRQNGIMDRLRAGGGVEITSPEM